MDSSKNLCVLESCAYGAADRLYRLYEAFIFLGLLEASHRRDMRRHLQEKTFFRLQLKMEIVNITSMNVNFAKRCHHAVSVHCVTSSFFGNTGGIIRLLQ
jgi:hypothetical protein